MSKVVLIFKKEILDALRDSRAFVVCIAMPFLLYPILFGVMAFFMQSELTKEARLLYEIGVINKSNLPDFVSQLEQTDKFIIIEDEDPRKLFNKDQVKIAIDIRSKNQIAIFYNGADKESQNALRRIEKILSDYQLGITKKSITDAGLAEEVLSPIAVDKINVAPASKMGGFFLGIIIPYMLMILAFQGAMRGAIDMTTGEKERKTIETLLVTDIKRSEIVIGKCLSTFMLALVATISGLLGLIISVQSGLSILSQMSKNFSMSVPWLSCILMLVIMLPLLWFFSSALVAIGSFSKSMNQATIYSTYCLILVIMLAIFSIVRMTTPSMVTFLIPVLNTAILQQQILVGEVKWLNLLITLGSSIFYAAITYLLAKNNFEKEEILLRS